MSTLKEKKKNHQKLVPHSAGYNSKCSASDFHPFSGLTLPKTLV